MADKTSSPVPQVLSVIDDMAHRYGMERRAFEATLRATVFPASASVEQFCAFLLVARKYGLNPVVKEIHAFPTKQGGIQPIVSIDGWLRMVNDQPQFDGMEFRDHHTDGELSAITCVMYRKDRTHPTEVTEYMDECKRSTEPWKQWPARMLRHKATIQAARYAFGFSGIYDPDEAERIADATESMVATIEPDAPSGSRSERALSIASTPERAVERLKADAGLKSASELAEMPSPAAAARDGAEDAAGPVSRSRPAESRATGPRAALPDGVSAVELPPKADLDALEGPSLAALCDAYGLKIAKGQGASDRNRDALEALARHRAADLVDDARELEAALRTAHEASHVEALREQWAAIDTELEGLTSYHSLAINRCRITMAVLLQEVSTRMPGNAT